jgi:hypothetical protein
MRDLIKKVLSEHTIKKEVITEMATQDWCKKYSKIYPTYYFCSAAESYIRDEMQVFDNGQKGRKRKVKKVFLDFEKGLEEYFIKNIDDSELSNKIIRIKKDSPIFIEGKKEIDYVGEKISNNCPNYKSVTDAKLSEFDDKVKLYFIKNGEYSNENRLPTNYSALANLFTQFFDSKGAFDGVGLNHDWSNVVKNWITHCFHPQITFNDIRPADERIHKLTDLSFQTLAKIYFSNDSVYNSSKLRDSIQDVLKGVREEGFKTEDAFQKQVLDKHNRVYERYAKDYGFVDMFSGIDFLIKEKNSDFWIPIQIKSRSTQPTYLIDKLGCKKYGIVEKTGKNFTSIIKGSEIDF